MVQKLVVRANSGNIFVLAEQLSDYVGLKKPGEGDFGSHEEQGADILSVKAPVALVEKLCRTPSVSSAWPCRSRCFPAIRSFMLQSASPT